MPWPATVTPATLPTQRQMNGCSLFGCSARLNRLCGGRKRIAARDKRRLHFLRRVFLYFTRQRRLNFEERRRPHRENFTVQDPLGNAARRSCISLDDEQVF